MSDFDRALAFVLEMEGGFVNNPKDPGGATNFGITQATYDTWNRGARRSVREITSSEVAAIYKGNYWAFGRCAALAWPLSLCHFDACVNHGIVGATKILQHALGVTGDGVRGPATEAAIAVAHPGTLFGAWYAARLKLYYDICQRRAESRGFLLGWVRRMVHLYAATTGG